MLICVAMSGDKCDQERSHKVLSYKHLSIEIQCRCNVKTKVIGTTGTISKSFRKYLSNISGKHKIKELQKLAILGTTHTSGSTNVKVQNIKHAK